MSYFQTLCVVVVLLVGTRMSGCSAQYGDLVDVLKAVKANTFLDFFHEADLMTLLENHSGPHLTVFAPTDAAFEDLPDEVTHRLMTDPQYRSEVLVYHLAEGEYFGRDFRNGRTIRSLFRDGKPIWLNIYDKPDQTVFTASGSPIRLFDQLATNGVVHVVDKLMYAVANHTADGDIFLCDAYTELYYLLQESGMNVTQYTGGHPFTLFIPNNQSFTKLPPGARYNWDHNPAALKEMLQYHMVNGTHFKEGFYNGIKLKTLAGKEMQLVFEFGQWGVNDTYSQPGSVDSLAKLIYADRTTTDGVIHVVDSVLLPPRGKLLNEPAEFKQGWVPLF